MAPMSEAQKREFFLELCTIRDNLFADEVLVKDIIDRHMAFLPSKKLYKFRKCNEQNFQTLSENGIWMSPASGFDDPFDSTINFSNEQKQYNDWLHKNRVNLGIAFAKQICENHFLPITLTEAELTYLVENCFEIDGKVISDKLDRYASTLPVQKRYEIRNILQLYNKKDVTEILTFDAVAKMLSEQQSHVQNISLIYCMTEYYENTSFWENYADNYTGFCIEYCFDQYYENDFEDYRNLMFLLPMTYCDKKPPYAIVPFIEDTFQDLILHNSTWKHNVSTDVDLNMQLYYKRRNYEYEREWRFAIRNKQNNKQFFPYVSGIYVGYKTTPDNIVRLQNIAKALKVPIYLQKPNIFNSDFEYIPID